MNTAAAAVPEAIIIPPKTSHADRAHAVLAPSSLDRTMRCLAALLPLEHPVPEVVTKEQLEGTRAHELFEQALKGNKKAFLAEPDKDMRHYIWEAAETVRKILNAIGRENILKKVSEYKVTFSSHIYGTLDVGILYVKDGIKKAYIFDLKYGKGVAVGARDNAQLQTYLVGLLQTENFDAKSATLAIYQPRNRDHSEKPLDQHTLTEKEIKQWRSKLIKFENQALRVLNGEKKAKEVVGEQCTWCPRKAVCRSFREAAAAQGLIEFDKAVPLPQTEGGLTNIENGVKTLTKPKTKQPKELTDEQLYKAIVAEKYVTAWFKALKKYAAGRHASGHKIPGLKFVEGGSRRKWIENEEAVIAELLTRYGVKEPYTKKLKNITEIEKQIGKKRMEKLTIKPPGKPILVPVEDEREELKTSAATELLTELEVEDTEDE